MLTSSHCSCNGKLDLNSRLLGKQLGEHSIFNVAHQASLKQLNLNELKEDGVNVLPLTMRALTLRIKCREHASFWGIKNRLGGRGLSNCNTCEWPWRKAPHDHSPWLLATTHFHWHHHLLTSVINHFLIQARILLSVPSFQPGLSSSNWHLQIRLQPQNQVMLPEPSSTFPHVAPPTIHEQFGEAEGQPLFNVAATPATIDAVISSVIQKVWKFLRRKMVCG